jgi:hypothetical protein
MTSTEIVFGRTPPGVYAFGPLTCYWDARMSVLEEDHSVSVFRLFGFALHFGFFSIPLRISLYA